VSRINTLVNIAGITFKNSVLPASGTFGSGQEIDMLEINISCSNVEHGGMAFGQEPGMVEHITKEVKKIAAQSFYMKLTPNVTDITEIAKTA